MSERGVFAIDRGIWDHPSFANEPLTEREAWAWLIGEASFKARTKRIGSAVIELTRGQVAASLRFMADKWQWSEPRVRRFLKRLKTDAMIDATTDAGITVITICNYNKYQRVSLPTDAVSDAPADAAATQQRRKVEDKEYKEDLSSLRSESARKRGTRLPEDWHPSEADWAAAIAKLGNAGAIEEISKFRDYWKAQPGQRGVKLDWDATFRNWIRNAKGPQANGRRTVQDAARDLHEGILRQIDAFDEPAPGGLRIGEGPGPVRLLPSR